MRLLHVDTKQLVIHPEKERPKYAILSHTWEDDEVLFEDISWSLNKARKKKTWSKISGTCTLAKANGYEYVWIDSCCIDKSSSAELSEAINSMFRWYEDSDVCYVYLVDVRKSEDLLEVSLAEHSISSSRWFTRGFTLQELLAPSSVKFYSMEWQELGSRRTLISLISQLTNIDEDALRQRESGFGKNIFKSMSVARKMSWAAHRETTRPEDTSYCLLGLFDVNMPLLYGEGKTKAYKRLQEQIMRQTGDQTILSWHATEFGPGTSWMANHPRKFVKSAGYIQIKGSVNYSVSEIGLQIRLPVRRHSNGDASQVWAKLECHDENSLAGQILLPLRVIGSSQVDEELQSHRERVSTPSQSAVLDVLSIMDLGSTYAVRRDTSRMILTKEPETMARSNMNLWTQTTLFFPSDATQYISFRKKRFEYVQFKPWPEQLVLHSIERNGLHFNESERLLRLSADGIYANLIFEIKSSTIMFTISLRREAPGFARTRRRLDELGKLVVGTEPGDLGMRISPAVEGSDPSNDTVFQVSRKVKDCQTFQSRVSVDRDHEVLLQIKAQSSVIFDHHVAELELVVLGIEDSLD